MPLDAPPPPQAVNPLTSMLGFAGAAYNPGLQSTIISGEQQFRPQYTNLNLAGAGQTLFGSAGQPGLMDFLGQAQIGQNALNNQLNNANIANNLGNLQNFYGQGIQDLLYANPGMAASIGGMGSAIAGNQAGGFRQAAFDALKAQQAGAGPGWQGVNAQTVQSGGTLGAQQVQGVNAVAPGQISAQQVGAVNAISPGQISAQQWAAAQAAAPNAIQEGVLGSRLYQQALAQEQGPLTQALAGRAQSLIANAGQLTGEELRAATQGSREQFAASGRLNDNASITGEALARAGASRERQMQDLAMAQGINQQVLGQQQAQQQFAAGILGQNLGMQGQNVANAMQGGQFNVAQQNAANLANQQAALAASQSNLSSGTQLSLANQQAAMQAQLANQNAALAAAQSNLSSGTQLSLANQAAAMDAQRLNQGANLQAGQFNISNAQDVQRMNQQANLQGQLANQSAYQNAYQFGQGQGQQNIQNLMGLSQMAGQDANQLFAQQQQLANMYNNLGGQSLGILGIGNTGPAVGMGYGSNLLGQGLGFSQSNLGPALSDPNAGINLDLANNANLANYNAAIYGANQARLGAEAAARGTKQGGIASGLGSILTNPVGSLLGKIFKF